MPQNTLGQKSDNLSIDRLKEFEKCISTIYEKLREKIVDRVQFDELIKGKILKREDTQEQERPESVTENIIILPILEFLGFEENISYFRYTGSKESQNECDITLKPRNQKILVESEPLNKNLNLKGSGFSQVESYLRYGGFHSDIGLATNGFLWMLGKYDKNLQKLILLRKINLLPLFRKIHGLPFLGNTSDILNDFYDTFGCNNILDSVKGNEIKYTIAKEKVSNSFYNDYVKYVFGVDNHGEKSYCLLDAIEPETLEDPIKRSFAVTLMNRLIFIKFLEDSVISEKNLLLELLTHFENQRVQVPQLSFYDTYLKPLFYKVFNKSVHLRDKQITDFYFFSKLPYLNGGLFRENIPNESSFNVRDDILIRIIKEILVGYSFGISIESEGDEKRDRLMKRTLDPDILGYVFEKTINFLTSPEKKERRKILGAYYTPDDITSYITSNTIQQFIIDLVNKALREDRSTTGTKSKISDISDLFQLSQLSNEACNKILNGLDSVRILDPACGSGHFLTSTLRFLLLIKSFIVKVSGIEPDNYEIKRQIISRNLYGVDIEETAVEITKLRLWLSLLEELDKESVGGIKTLPNIEYNVIHGNSLIGWHNEKFDWDISTQFKDEKIEGIVDGLEVAYSNDKSKRELLHRAKMLLQDNFPKLDDISNAYGALKEVYVTEQGEKAVSLKNVLEEVRKRIYNIINPIFINSINKKIRKSNSSKDIGQLNPIFPLHWPVDFNEVIVNGGFDIIIGNPPYGAEFDLLEKKYCLSKFETAKQNGNSAMMFIQRCYELLSPTGRLGLIVPKSLSYAQHWELGRNYVLKDLVSVYDVSKAFKDVKLEQIIIRIDKFSNRPDYSIGRHDDNKQLLIKKDLCAKTGTLILWGNSIDLLIFKKMNKSRVYIKNVTKTNRGLPLQSKMGKTKIGFPVLTGKDISQFRYAQPKMYISENALKKYESEVSKMQNQEKIVSQRIVAHVKKPYPHIIITSALDLRGMLSVDTVENTYLIGGKYSLEFIALTFNLKLISWYAYRYIFSNAIRTMDLDDYYIGKIPLPSIRKIKNVESKLDELKKEPLKNIDELEDLFASLYGLTKDQLKLVLKDFIGKDHLH